MEHPIMLYGVKNDVHIKLSCIVVIGAIPALDTITIQHNTMQFLRMTK